MTREDLIAECDVILQPKPMLSDIAELRAGQVLWGWPHCVQDEKLTQVAIDRRLTLIAFEAMNHWNADGPFNLHVFHRNNELAGYCSVLHALQLAGLTGSYGRRLRAAVIGFGATARGAVSGPQRAGRERRRRPHTSRGRRRGAPDSHGEVVPLQRQRRAPEGSATSTPPTAPYR